MNERHSCSRLQNSVDLHGLFHSFSSVLHEWLKTGHKSFTTRQLFPMPFLSACLVGPGAQQGLLPINNTQQAQVENAALFIGCLHSSFRSSKQNTGKIQATKSKPTIFQGWCFIYNPGELLGAMGTCSSISS